VAKLNPTISAQSARPPASAAAPEPPPAIDGDLLDRVTRVIDLIRPAVQADGGDVELLGLTPPPEVLARIRLHGACVGCPSAAVTLQLGIERNLRQYVPEIRGIQVVD
jgi:Fe-S cluster biogenesis protein NfuA